jgi:hypothetical protein
MFRRIGVASVAVLLMAAMAQAQPPGQGRGRGQGFGGFGGFGRGFGMGYGQLVGIEEVQTELKVTEDQKTALEKQADERRAAREQQGQGGRGFGDFQNLTEEERNERIAQFRKDAAEREKKTREQIATVLDDAQMKRLREIWVQTLGVGALSNEEVAAELKITDLQKEEIADTQQEAGGEMFEKLRELGQQQDGDEAARNAKRDELRKEMEEKVLANLNDDQRKQFEAMKGTKFDLPRSAFGFGGRGRGGRPGGDGAGGDGGGRRRPDGDGGNNGGGNRPRRPDSV